jgi:hypothetical protein
MRIVDPHFLRNVREQATRLGNRQLDFVRIRNRKGVLQLP